MLQFHQNQIDSWNNIDELLILVKIDAVNQRFWNYLDSSGRKNTLGLAHSPKSGHLMVYYNQEILIVDFEIFHDKEYSFFVDEEFCHLHIFNNNGTFDYNIDIDHQIETPLNLAKKAEEKAEWKMKFKIAGISLFILFLIYLITFLFFRKN